MQNGVTGINGAALSKWDFFMECKNYLQVDDIQSSWDLRLPTFLPKQDSWGTLLHIVLLGHIYLVTCLVILSKYGNGELSSVARKVPTELNVQER